MKRLTEILYNNLENNSEVVFIFNEETPIYGNVVNTGRDTYYINIRCNSNDLIFNMLEIQNKNTFVEQIVGYKIHYGLISGCWPEVKSMADLEKVLKALLKVNKPKDIKTISNTEIKIKIKPIKPIKLNFKL